ncbi:sigma-70 family RNA polymerase sigma factor [Candidatus Berkiella cookevillensis]|uniref:RNA polymerase sigma factor n=1 Tax=Candidatus Berkiella cookevillensis TaxID=437022 RepID=A0A0Q9YTV4_9GAMM|nr:sigma-70 family RNA polymerase sigma factor [Candidatus Berkiella cookevillensis]MCS5708390.1 sigma-70 family RNA polymerase sigma factor [Candidatus Berkiella cookevillensis]
MKAENAYVHDPSVQKYINSIKKINTLNAEQEKEIIKKAQQGDKKAKNILINAHLKLVVSIARRYQRRGLALSDLIEEGNMGLIYAVDKFNIEVGVRFASYATWWIRQSIERALMNQTRLIRVPIYFIKKYSKFLRLKNEIAFQKKPRQSPEEIAEYLNMSVESADKVINFEQQDISLDSFAKPNQTPLWDLLYDEQNLDPVDAISQKHNHLLLEGLLKHLSAQELEVLEKRFGIHGYEHMSLAEIGKELNLTRERVRQIQNKALQHLHKDCKLNGFDLRGL